VLIASSRLRQFVERHQLTGAASGAALARF
jgi:hypothetical protein